MLPDSLMPYAPAAAVVAGVVMLVWGQRDRLTAMVGRLWSAVPTGGDTPASDDEAEMTAHEAYACLRRLLAEVKDCPKATEALEFVVLPALVSGTDAPHYQVTWEAKP